VLTLTRVAGVVTGFATIGTTTLELRAIGGGRHVLYEVDPATVPSRDGVERTGQPAADALASSDAYGANGAATVDATSLVVQDVLVVYTAKAANRWGRATLEGMIHNAVQSANQAYQNSRVGVSLDIANLQQVAFTESGSGMQATLDALARNSTVRSLRDLYAADMVVLVSEDSNYCGYASLSMANGNTDAYAVVWSSCLSSQSLAHEVGHLQGLDHNREDGSNGGFYPYGYGYRVCKGDGFRDVMSYACPSISVARVLQFSNPNVHYNGYATGIDYETSPSTAADTARALVNSATTVANYRVATSTSSAPAAPSGLATTTVKFDRVGLAWSDSSSNESGFRLQRSADGVAYTVIATLPAGTRAYTDVSVVPQKAYFYRVRAYNSAGGSGFSNVVSVKTPMAPPDAPSSVAAANNGNGTATVKWADASGNESRFDIRRARYDWKTGTWLAGSVIATVGANVTKYVDACGNGKYRYLVRAANGGGVSKYVGPAVVTVTGG
jgi:hypothetical protein